MAVVGDIVCSELGQVARGGSFFLVKYCELYGVCDFVVLSVFDVCVDYGGVNVSCLS